MKKNSLFVLFFAGLISLMFIFVSAAGSGEKTVPVTNVKGPDLKVKKQEIYAAGIVKPDLDFGKFPLYFISNKG